MRLDKSRECSPHSELRVAVGVVEGEERGKGVGAYL